MCQYIYIHVRIYKIFLVIYRVMKFLFFTLITKKKGLLYNGPLVSVPL